MVIWVCYEKLKRKGQKKKKCKNCFFGVGLGLGLGVYPLERQSAAHFKVNLFGHMIHIRNPIGETNRMMVVSSNSDDGLMRKTVLNFEFSKWIYLEM